MRNLPKSVTDKQLKKLFLDAVATAPAAAEPGFKKDIRIRQVKIVMGENERSKGFGFVEFEDHDHALIGLREVNNSPKYFGEKRRLLVEFALEDKRVVEGRQKRLQLQQVKQKKIRALDEQDARDGTAKRKPAAQAQAQQKGGNKKAPNSAASPQKPAGQKPQPQQPAGQKRKREDSNNGNGNGNNKKAAVKNDNKAGKEGARQQKKQKVAPQQQQDEKSQPQRKRAREADAEAPPALSRKARAAVKKRKDIDALDSMGTLSSPLVVHACVCACVCACCGL